MIWKKKILSQQHNNKSVMKIGLRTVLFRRKKITVSDSF